MSQHFLKLNQDDWRKWDDWKKINEDIDDAHCAYLKAQYNSLDIDHHKVQTATLTNPSKLRKRVYELVNMWGFHDVCPVIEYDSPAIKCIYEIVITNCEKIYFDE